MARALARGVGPSRCLAGGGAAPCLGGPLWSRVQKQPLCACVSKRGLQVVASDPPAASLSWAFSSLPLAVRGFGSLREGSRHAGYRSFFSEAPRLLLSGTVNLWAGHKLDLDGVVLVLVTLSCQPGQAFHLVPLLCGLHLACGDELRPRPAAWQERPWRLFPKLHEGHAVTSRSLHCTGHLWGAVSRVGVHSHGPGWLWRDCIARPCPLADARDCCCLTRVFLGFSNLLTKPVLQNVFPCAVTVKRVSRFSGACVCIGVMVRVVCVFRFLFLGAAVCSGCGVSVS